MRTLTHGWHQQHTRTRALASSRRRRRRRRRATRRLCMLAWPYTVQCAVGFELFMCGKSARARADICAFRPCVLSAVGRVCVCVCACRVELRLGRAAAAEAAPAARLVSCLNGKERRRRDVEVERRVVSSTTHRPSPAQAYYRIRMLGSSTRFVHTAHVGKCV